jgi:endonuclease YncB( thermonuclease family)
MKFLIHLVTLTSLLISQIAYAATLSGLVVGVTDGDTITVLDGNNTQHKIRLGGIDAPEKKQAFGNVSKKSLSDLVYDKRVDVDWHKHDRYGRIVGKVIVDGIDANLAQIKRGMAWYFKKYKSELVLEDRLSYSHAQESAENERLGLWVDNSPIAPWVFRKAQR